MLARDYVTEGKIPIVLSSPMIGGLGENEEKMSKSNPDSAIFMEDSEEEVRRKIKRSFCPPKTVSGNSTIEFVKFFAFFYAGKFHVKRLEKYGGDLHYECFDKFCADYEQGLIDPADVKSNLAETINRILEPVRRHFAEDPFAKKINELVKMYQKENEEAKRKEAKTQPKQEVKSEAKEDTKKESKE